MAFIAAVLTITPHGLGSEGVVPIGSTSDPRALRAVRDALLDDARQQALLWHGIDAGVLTLKAAEYERLVRVLTALLPEEEIRPDLKIVRGNRAETDPPGDPRGERP